MREHGTTGITIFLGLLLIGMIGFVAYAALWMEEGGTPPPAPSGEAVYLRTDADPAGKRPGTFSPAEIPPWLYVHVGVIGCFQILSILAAARVAARDPMTRRDGRTVVFLCEVPMFLGLFGTLLGVCLTQFTTGTLVAPLAYLTTMAGVVLHVLAKLTIWLKLPEELLED